MHTVVIAATVIRAQQVAQQAGIQRPILMSPHSMKHYGAGRGIIVDTVLVDASALPLDADALEAIDVMRMASAR